MTDPAQITLLSRWLEGTDIVLLELTGAQGSIRLRRDPADTHAVHAEEAISAPTTILAPSVGIFRRAHPCRIAPLVEPGARVAEGDAVGLLQIGALLLHVRAPHAGTVLAMLAEDGAVLGYGAPLVHLARAG